MEISAAAKKSIFLFKRFGLYLFLPLFLYFAYLHVRSLYPQYRSTAKIAVRGVLVDSVANTLTSKAFVSKTLDQLPFYVSFYSPADPERELYGDSIPVQFTFRDFRNTGPDAWFELSLSNNTNYYALTEGDTTSYPKFNEPVSGAFGKFVVNLKPNYRSGYQDILFKLNDPTLVLEQVYNDLKVETDQHNRILSISVKSGNPRKSVDLIYALTKNYTAQHPYKANKYKQEAPAPVKPKPSRSTVNPEKQQAEENIARLKNRADHLEAQIAGLRSASNPGPNPQVEFDSLGERTADDETQLKIFADIKPLALKPIDQFVQLPHADAIDDQFLRTDVNKFNQAELDKRRMIADGNAGSERLAAMNNKLLILQSSVVEGIESEIENMPPENPKAKAPKNVHALINSKKEELAQVRHDILTATQDAAEIPATQTKPAQVSVQPLHVAVASIPSGHQLVMLYKPENNIEYLPVNGFAAYFIAILAGLFIPFAGWILRKMRRGTSGSAINTGKLSEKLHDIFAVKQID